MVPGKFFISGGEAEEIISLLQERGYTYSKDRALWLKTSNWGDDKDRVLVRENGSPTYFASTLLITGINGKGDSNWLLTSGEQTITDIFLECMQRCKLLDFPRIF